MLVFLRAYLVFRAAPDTCKGTVKQQQGIVELLRSRSSGDGGKESCDDEGRIGEMHTDGHASEGGIGLHTWLDLTQP